MKYLTFIALSLLASEVYTTATERPRPTVVVNQGTLIGTATVVAEASPAVNKFLGVSFAVSPPKRFEPPQPVPASFETFETSRWSDRCIEDSSPESPLAFDGPESEDCLYLNVYVPNTPTQNKTVLFWIHGGALRSGTAGMAIYDGAFFAAHEDVIVVSANYRTNVFGFSNSPDLPPSWTNVGFLDQRLAVSWVQQNVAAFGGDPGKVTLFGESSGASSIDRLLTSPPVPLPFRGAILQSGQASVSLGSGADGRSSWNKLADVLGCDNTPGQLKCVQDANASDVKKAMQDNSLSFPAVNDDRTQKATPLTTLRAVGAAANVPVLVGINGLEASYFLQPLVQQRNASAFTNAAAALLEQLLGEGPARFMLNRIPSARTKTTSGFFFALSHILSDALYLCPIAQLTRASAAAGTPTWRYLFNATFPNTQSVLALPDRGIDNVGSYHASEIPIAFGTFGIFEEHAPSTAEQTALSRYMMRTWANFAKEPREGPGWAPVTDTNSEAIGCIGCDQNPEGLSMINSTDTDHGCSQLDLLYSVHTPLY